MSNTLLATIENINCALCSEESVREEAYKKVQGQSLESYYKGQISLALIN